MPVPPLVSERLGPSPQTASLGKATVMVTEHTAGDDLQIGDRYVLNLNNTTMRCGVHVFTRHQTLVLPGETRAKRVPARNVCSCRTCTWR